MQIDFLKVDVDGCDAWCFSRPKTLRPEKVGEWNEWSSWGWNFIPIGDSQFEMIGYSVDKSHWLILEVSNWSVVFLNGP